MYGARCFYCGYQEGEHFEGSAEAATEAQAKEVNDGFTHSLYSCEGFHPQDPEMEIKHKPLK